METMTNFIFLGSKITTDGDCSRKIKRHLLLRRKAMTNLDSVLKSRNITLLTKVCMFKAMVVPLVMYGCESWTTKNTVLKNWCFWIMVLEKTLESPLDFKEIKSVNPKGNEYSLEGLMLKLKLQYLGHLLWRANSLEKTLMLGKIEGRRRSGQQRMRWLDITDLTYWILSKLWEMMRVREPCCAAVHGVSKSPTQLSDWATTIRQLILLNIYSTQGILLDTGETKMERT